MTADTKQALLRAVVLEAKLGGTYRLPIMVDLQQALILMAHVQLSLRHPAIKDKPAALIAQEIIDQVIDRVRQDGYIAHARLMEIGNNPEHDEL